MENSVLKLHNKALISAETYKKAQIGLIDVLMQLDSKRAYYQFDCNSLFEYCTKLLKLSESCSYKFIRIARTSKKVPELRRSLEKGEISTSKAVSLCSVLNPLNRSNPLNPSHSKNLTREDPPARNQALQNPDVGERTEEDQVVANRSVNDWLEIAKKSTNRELEVEIIVSRPKDFSLVESKRALSKDISSLHLKLPKQIMVKLDRTQDLLNKQGKNEASYTEVLDQLLDFYLERKDPLKKVGKKPKLERSLLTKVCKKTNPKRSFLTKVCKKTNSERSLLTKVCKKTNSERSLLTRGCKKTNLEKLLQKVASQETSLQTIKKEIPPKDMLNTQIPTKTVTSKPRFRRALPQRIRTQVFQKYQTCCYRKVDGTRCNQTRYLEIHHKIPVAKGGSDSPDNLVLLCSSCHRLHHQKEAPSISRSINSKKRNRNSWDNKVD